MKTTIAIADDHALMRKALDELLSRYFDVVITATDGKDLMDKIKLSGSVPDIVILAVFMPVLDGFDTAAALKKLYPEIRVAAFSMNGEKSVINKMLASGADSYVLKPDIYKLIKTINELAGETYSFVG